MSNEKTNIGVEPVYDAKKLGNGRMLLLGFQHMFAMFGATVLVPILTGLNMQTTLLMAGLELYCSTYLQNLRYRHSLVHPLHF